MVDITPDFGNLLRSYDRLAVANRQKAIDEYNAEKERESRYASGMRTIGSVAGAIVGAYVGGPAGSAVGAKIGNTAGGMVSQSQGKGQVSGGEVVETAGSVYQYSETKKAEKTKQEGIRDNKEYNSMWADQVQNDYSQRDEALTESQQNYLDKVRNSSQDLKTTYSQGKMMGLTTDTSRESQTVVQIEAQNAAARIEQAQNGGNLSEDAAKGAMSQIVAILRDKNIKSSDKVKAIKGVAPNYETRIVDFNVTDENTGETRTVKAKQSYFAVGGGDPVAVSEPVPLEPGPGLTKKDIDKNIETLSTFGIITDPNQKAQFVLNAPGQTGPKIFSLTDEQKAQVEGTIDFAKNSPAQVRAAIRKANPRAAVGAGFESVPGIDIIPDVKIESLRDNPTFQDDLNQTFQTNAQKGVNVARKLIAREVNNRIYATPENTLDRLDAMKTGRDLLLKSGNDKEAAKLDSQITKLSADLAEERKEAAKARGVKQEQDKVVQRKRQQILDSTKESLDEAKRIDRLYDPEFFGYAGRAKTSAYKFLDNLSRFQTEDEKKGYIQRITEGLGGDEDAKARLQQAVRLERAIAQSFNKYRKDITGAQASYKEIKFLEQALYSKTNSPAEFEAAVENYIGFLQRRERVVSKMINEGYSMPGEEGYDEDRYMKGMREERIKELKALFLKRNPGMTRDELQDKIMDRMFNEGLLNIEE